MIVAANKSDLLKTPNIGKSGPERSHLKKSDLLSSPRSECSLPAAHAEEPALNGRNGGLTALPTSALTGEGIAALREKILALATGGAAAEPGILTNLRQHQAVATALSALADAAQANATGIPHEMILLDLYRALWALDSLTGQTTPDDILNLIFSTFCIGK